MELNEVKYGFRLIDKKEIKDINVVMYRYLHLKSNATVVHFACDDVNKAFAIGFKTVPMDSTGVCHILEHSVLCGSKKYPLKEPFVNLLKTSLATFLNAFTSSDWTMYPFASANNKDFDNILGIYLDAVFNPLVMEDKKAFLQEGWHYELFNKDDTPTIKGVVYNEMKGAMSSVNRILSEATSETMFKDTTYHYNSGGDPEVIPTLSYEKYKEFYHKHYTPQNALTFFYGDLDIEPRLKFLDEEYFSKYNKSEEIITIPSQSPYIDTTKTIEYSVSEEEPLNNNSYISLCYSLGDYKNYEEFLALNILFDALLGTNDSPITKAILDKKLGEDLGYYIDDSSIIPTLYLALKKTNKDKQKDFINAFKAKVEELVKNGIDKNLLLAKINKYEFIDKEQDSGSSPKGIGYAINLMSEFNYDVPFETRFEFEKYYKKYKQELNNGYFEKLLDKYILNSNHYVSVVCNPSRTLAKEKKEKMDKQMLDLKNSMSDKEIEDLIKMNNELLAYQSHVDTKEELKCLPTLKIKDLRKDVDALPSKKIKVNGMNGIYHKVNTNHISYLKLYFDINKIAFEDLKYVFLIYELLVNVPTSHYSINELNNLIDTYLGEFRPGEYVASYSKEDYKYFFKLNLSSLDEFTSYMPKVLNEVLLHSKFSKKIVLQNLKQSINNIKNSIINSGNRIAVTEGNAMFTKGCALESKGLIGVKLYQDLKDLLDNFDYQTINKKLKETCARLFNKKNVFFSISGDENSLEAVKSSLKELKLPRKEYEDILVPVLDKKENKAIIIPSQVNYNAICCNYEDLGYQTEEHIGKLGVLASIINYDYLWNNVRVKGGAYGCNIGAPRSNDMYISSYRDPNVKYSYEAYSGLAEYVKNLKLRKDELESYIIGACAPFEKPVSIPAQINQADINYFGGFDKKKKKERKKDIISTKLEDLNNYAPLFNDWLNNTCKCSVGNKDKISELEFDKIITL